MIHTSQWEFFWLPPQVGPPVFCIALCLTLICLLKWVICRSVSTKALPAPWEQLYILLLFVSSAPNLGLPWWLRWWIICLQCKRPRFDPWVRKIPWRREWLPTQVFLSGEFCGQRTLAGSGVTRVGHNLSTKPPPPPPPPPCLTWVWVRGRPQLSCIEHQYQSQLSSLSLFPGILRHLLSRTIPFIMALSHLPPGTDGFWVLSGCDSGLLSMTEFSKSRTLSYFFLCSAWTHMKLSTTTVWFWNGTGLLGCHHFNGVVLIAVS